jgi:predicted nucleic acid-binding protein
MANWGQMRPLRLHLDTSDYSAMYRAVPGTDQARVRDRLLELARSGRIEIGLSHHVVFELLQKAEPQFREDRLERARLLKELCGQNAFPYPTDLGCCRR